MVIFMYLGMIIFGYLCLSWVNIQYQTQYLKIPNWKVTVNNQPHIFERSPEADSARTETFHFLPWACQSSSAADPTWHRPWKCTGKRPRWRCSWAPTTTASRQYLEDFFCEDFIGEGFLGKDFISEIFFQKKSSPKSAGSPNNVRLIKLVPR